MVFYAGLATTLLNIPSVLFKKLGTTQTLYFISSYRCLHFGSDILIQKVVQRLRAAVIQKSIQ
jgi:hypothetical protein